MNEARAAAEALFSGPVERIARKTRRTGSIHDRAAIPNQREVAQRLRQLETMADRLTVWHNDAERFHRDKSELKIGLGNLAKQLEGR